MSINTVVGILDRLKAIGAIQAKLYAVRGAVSAEHNRAYMRATMAYRRTLKSHLLESKESYLAAVKERRESDATYAKARADYQNKMRLINAKLVPLAHEERVLKKTLKQLRKRGL